MKRNILLVFLVAICATIVLPSNFVFAEVKKEVSRMEEKIVLIKSSEDYMNKGDLVSAETEIKKALEIDKNDFFALRVLARIYAAWFEKTSDKKYLELAQNEVEKSLKFAPEDPWCNVTAAVVYSYQNDKIKAAKAIESALKAEPTNKYMQDLKKKIQQLP